MAESTSNQRAIQIGDVVKLTKNDSTVEYYVITNIIATAYPINIHISEMLHPDNIKHILIAESGQQTIMSPDHSENFTTDYKVTYVNEGQLSSKDILLSGVPDIDIQILVQMDDVALIRLCQLDTYTRSLCNNSKLWSSKISNKFGDISVNPDISLKENYIELTKYPETRDGLDQATKDGNLPLVQWLLDTYPGEIIPDFLTLNSAAEGGHLDIIEWLMDTYKIQPTGTTVIRAIKYGQTKVLDWLNQLKLVDSTKSDQYIKSAIRGDSPESLEWLKLHKFDVAITIDMVMTALTIGSLKILKIWRDRIIPILRQYRSGSVFSANFTLTPNDLISTYITGAIKNRNGSVELVKFLMSLDPSITLPINSVSAATSSCNLDIIKYLRGLPSPQQPSIDSIKNAISKNCSKVIEYYIETSPGLLNSKNLEYLFVAAGQHGDVDMVKTGLKLNPPIYPDVNKILTGSGSPYVLKVLQFAASLNPPIYPSGKKLQKMVDDSGSFWSIDIIKFLAHMPDPIFPSVDAINNLIIYKFTNPHNDKILEYIANDPVIPAGLRMMADTGLKITR